MAACGGDGSGGNVPAGKATLCGPDLCLSLCLSLSLCLAENPELATVGGVLVFAQAPGKPD